MNDAFASKIDYSGECWEWTAALNSRGYGVVSIDGKLHLAHRVSYERNMAPIGEGLTIDHLCRNKRCVRPSHLEPVPLAVNIQRKWEAYTSCKRGHEMSGDNVRVHKRQDGSTNRECRECGNARRRVKKVA